MLELCVVFGGGYLFAGFGDCSDVYYRYEGVASRLTPDRFNVLMTSAPEANWGMNGGKDWAEQSAFLLSQGGYRIL